MRQRESSMQMLSKKDKIKFLIKRILFPIAAVCLALIIAIGVLELFCRLLPNITGTYTTVRNTIPQVYIEDEERGHALLPSSVARHFSCYGDFDVIYHINAQGIRSLKMSYGQKTGKRILLLGDSFVFGCGVEDDETLSVSLEEILNNRYPEAGFEVINAAVPSYATVQEYLTLKRFIHLSPDIVLLGLCTNDRIEDKKWVVDEAGDIVRINEPGCYVNQYHQLILNPEPTSLFRRFCRDHLFIYSFLGIVRQRISKGSRPQYKEFPMGARSLGVLSLIKDYCKNNGAQFAIFTTEPSMPKHVGAKINSLNIPFFDISELYSKNKALCYPIDGHWSPSGTRYIANWLADCLQKEIINAISLHEEEI